MLEEKNDIQLAQDLAGNLAMFQGTDTWYRHPLCHNFLYTDGVKFFAEHMGNGAYWFLDIIATEVAELQEQEEFLAITLKVNQQNKAGNQAVINVTDGNSGELYRKTIDYTDAYVGDWKFYLTNNVCLLPSEY